MQLLYFLFLAFNVKEKPSFLQVVSLYRCKLPAGLQSRLFHPFMVVIGLLPVQNNHISS
jgi:hypothetical protein